MYMGFHIFVMINLLHTHTHAHTHTHKYTHLSIEENQDHIYYIVYALQRTVTEYDK